MPAARTHSAAPVLLLLCALTATLYLLSTLRGRAGHDDALRLRASTPLFRYAVSTYANTAGNRCALLRFLSEPDDASPPTICDVVTVVATPVAPASVSPQLGVVDYVAVHWDALSRTYNDGLFYAARTVRLRRDPALLPTFGKAVHFPLARDSRDISPDWFSVFPSNVSRAVFKAWHHSALNLPKSGAVVHPLLVTLNRARNCRNKEVECHPRDAAIAHACDGLPGVKQCEGQLTPGWIPAFIVALTFLIISHFLLDTLGGFVPRHRLVNLRTLVGANFTPARKELLVLIAFGLAVLLSLAALPRWPDIVAVLARPLSVSVNHRLHNFHVDDPMDAFAGAADLRGRWDGYAYTLADGADCVRISGPGAALVVMLFGWTMQVREAVATGVLVRCLMMVAILRALCLLVKAVGGMSERRREEEDEYATRLEAALFRRTKERNRSFLSQRDLLDRDRANAKNNNAKHSRV